MRDDWSAFLKGKMRRSLLDEGDKELRELIHEFFEMVDERIKSAEPSTEKAHKKSKGKHRDREN